MLFRHLKKNKKFFLARERLSPQTIQFLEGHAGRMALTCKLPNPEPYILSGPCTLGSTISLPFLYQAESILESTPRTQSLLQ